MYNSLLHSGGPLELVMHEQTLISAYNYNIVCNKPVFILLINSTWGVKVSPATHSNENNKK